MNRANDEKPNLVVINLIIIAVVIACMLMFGFLPKGSNKLPKSGNELSKNYSNYRLRREGFSTEKADQLSDVISEFQEKQLNK